MRRFSITATVLPRSHWHGRGTLSRPSFRTRNDSAPSRAARERHPIPTVSFFFHPRRAFVDRPSQAATQAGTFADVARFLLDVPTPDVPTLDVPTPPAPARKAALSQLENAKQPVR